MKKLLREPLVHFILIGIGLFLLYGWVSDRNRSPDTIYFDDYDMNNIIASWEMQWKRLPTDEELKSLVDQKIRQEVFYQEALKMNLDHNDEIIRRRLAQKMNFLSNDLATLKEPTTEELQEYFEENREKYMSPPVFSFYQLPFRADTRKSAREDAERVLGNLLNSPPETASGYGDPLPFPYFFSEADKREIDRQLGLNFSLELESIPVGSWSGPLQSGFGWHLVYVTQKTPAAAPELNSIREEVQRDLEYEKQKNLNDQVYAELKKNYEIEFDLDPEKFDAAFVDYLRDLEKSRP